jgi:collagen type VI alpha
LSHFKTKLIKCNNYPSGCQLSADIVFALDASTSVGQTNFQELLDVVTSIIAGLNVGSQTRIGVLTFATEVNVLFNLDTFASKQELLNGMSPYYTGGTTNTADAIRTANEVMFTSGRGDRDGVKNILVILSDGASNDPSATLAASIDARTRSNDPIHIVTIGIGARADHAELRALANDPTDRNYMLIANWMNLVDSLRGFGADICNGK